MKSLEQIGREQFTEKVGHGYLPIYERLWKDLQYKEIILLEIGIYNGNSLRTWCEWFLNATIVGIDHNPNNPMQTDRAKLHFGKQEDVAFLRSVAEQYNGFDIIIDDGSHMWEDQQISFETLWPYIVPGGMYIIEDLHTSGDPFWAKGEQDTIEYLNAIIGNLLLGVETPIRSIECYSKMTVLHKRGLNE